MLKRHRLICFDMFKAHGLICFDMIKLIGGGGGVLVEIIYECCI